MLPELLSTVPLNSPFVCSTSRRKVHELASPGRPHSLSKRRQGSKEHSGSIFEVSHLLFRPCAGVEFEEEVRIPSNLGEYLRCSPHRGRPFVLCPCHECGSTGNAQSNNPITCTTQPRRCGTLDSLQRRHHADSGTATPQTQQSLPQLAYSIFSFDFE